MKQKYYKQKTELSKEHIRGFYDGLYGWSYLPFNWTVKQLNDYAQGYKKGKNHFKNTKKDKNK